MIQNSPILLPLDGSKHALKSLGCAAYLAREAGARLHVLSASPSALSARAELERLRVPEAYWPLIELHCVSSYEEREILAAIERHRIGLLILPAQPSEKPWPGPESGDSALDYAVGQVAESVLEGVTTPVLVIPPEYREALPWQRVLVAVSGGRESESALAFAIDLAKTLDLGLSVVHVANSGAEGLPARTRYPDARHHEYPAQLDELLERQMLAETCAQRLRQLVLGRGDVVTELLKVVREERPGVLVGGWHGKLSPGRAVALKTIISSVPIPIALVKAGSAPRFRLKVGEDFD